MKKVITISAALLSVVTLTACGSKSTSSKEKDHSSTTKIIQKANNTEEAILKYNEIKLGSENKKGKGGTTEKVVKAYYGDPNSTQKSTLEGTTDKTTIYTWNIVGKAKNGLKMSAEFLDGKAISKSYANNNKSPKISTKTLNEIKKNDTYTKAKNKLGVPIGESDVKSDIGSIKTLRYSTGKKEVLMSFTNNKLLFKKTAAE